jgi:hypothetical protein
MTGSPDPRQRPRERKHMLMSHGPVTAPGRRWTGGVLVLLAAGALMAAVAWSMRMVLGPVGADEDDEALGADVLEHLGVVLGALG